MWHGSAMGERHHSAISDRQHRAGVLRSGPAGKIDSRDSQDALAKALSEDWSCREFHCIAPGHSTASVGSRTARSRASSLELKYIRAVANLRSNDEVHRP